MCARGLNAQIRAGASVIASGVQTICIRQAWLRRAGARTSTHPRRPRSPPRRNPCSRVFARALGLLRESVPATRVAPPATFSPLSLARALQTLRACARVCAPAQVGECPRLSVNGRRPARAHARARPSPAAAGRRSTAYPPARKRAHSCARSCSSESSPNGASSAGFTTDLSPVISSLSPPLSASMSSSARIARGRGRGGGRGSGKRQGARGSGARTGMRSARRGGAGAGARVRPGNRSQRARSPTLVSTRRGFFLAQLAQPGGRATVRSQGDGPEGAKVGGAPRA